jgi:hypothetical protein
MTNSPSSGRFDPSVALDGLLPDVGLSSADTGATVAFSGEDPMLPARHRLGRQSRDSKQ